MVLIGAIKKDRPVTVMRRPLALTAATLLVVLAAGGCGSDSKTGSTSTSTRKAQPTTTTRAEESRALAIAIGNRMANRYVQIRKLSQQGTAQAAAGDFDGLCATAEEMGKLATASEHDIGALEALTEDLSASERATFEDVLASQSEIQSAYEFIVGATAGICG